MLRVVNRREFLRVGGMGLSGLTLADLLRGAGQRPAFGSIVSRLEKHASPLPPYVSLSQASTDQFEFEKPYYAGSGHAPFRPFGEAIEDLKPAKSLGQLQDRKQLLSVF